MNWRRQSCIADEFRRRVRRDTPDARRVQCVVAATVVAATVLAAIPALTQAQGAPTKGPLATAAVQPPVQPSVLRPASQAFPPPQAQQPLYWYDFASPTSAHLWDVAMVSRADGWAVGTGGTILRWDGDAWNPVPSPTQQLLLAVDAVTGDDVWAVGGEVGNSVVLHWDGVAWSQAPAPPYGQQVAAIDMLNETDGWIATTDQVPPVPTVFRWDGAKWNTVTDPTQSGGHALVMTRAGDGWLGTHSGHILRWNGSSWLVSWAPPVIQDRPRVSAIDVLSAEQAWAAGCDRQGEAFLASWDGATWTEYAESLVPCVGDIDMVSATDGWFVGEFGAVGRWDGSKWRLAHGMETDEQFLRGVTMLSETEGWAVGRGGQILRCCAQPAGQAFLPSTLRRACLLCPSPNDSNTSGAVSHAPFSGSGDS